MKKMEDFFDLAHLTAKNKAMITRFKLEKLARLWWKSHYIENIVDAQTTTWDYIKEKLKLNYQNNTYMVERINKILDYNQGTKYLEGYY